MGQILWPSQNILTLKMEYFEWSTLNFNIQRDSKQHASHKHNKTFSFFPPGGSVVQPTCIGLHARFIIAKKRRKRRSGKGYDGPRSELYSNSSRKMQAAALAGSFTIVCRAAAVGRWLSVRLSVPRSCCRSTQLPGGEITKAKIQTKKPWDCSSFIFFVKGPFLYYVNIKG